MIIQALVYTGKHGKNYSVEGIVCFDTCIFCGGFRHKTIGTKVSTIGGYKNIHNVYCNCDPYTPHYDLNIEFKIICMLNNYGIVCDIDLTP